MSSLYLLRPECFSPERKELDKKRPKLDKRLRDTATDLVNELTNKLQKIYWISAPRGVIPIRIQAGEDPTWVGKNGQHLIYILSEIFGQRARAN